MTRSRQYLAELLKTPHMSYLDLSHNGMDSPDLLLKPLHGLLWLVLSHNQDLWLPGEVTVDISRSTAIVSSTC